VTPATVHFYAQLYPEDERKTLEENCKILMDENQLLTTGLLDLLQQKTQEIESLRESVRMARYPSYL
jgi:hypothetical protein